MNWHAPGPWSVGWDDGSGRFEDGSGAWIIDSNENNVIRDWGLAVGVLKPHDARLRDAAQELLEALQALYQVCKRELADTEDCGFMGQAEIAIAKATGETP